MSGEKDGDTPDMNPQLIPPLLPLPLPLPTLSHPQPHRLLEEQLGFARDFEGRLQIFKKKKLKKSDLGAEKIWALP